MTNTDISHKVIAGGGRNISLDLLRIIAMMMVLILHTNLFGGFLKIESKDAYGFLITLYEHISIVAVDVFVIISAWFFRTKETSFTKVVTLFWIILFWTVVMSMVAVLLGETITLKDIVKSIPFIGRAYDFCGGYIIMYLCSPYLNKMLDNISKKQQTLFAIGSFILFSCFSPVTSSHYLLINGGYSFVWFIILYIITAWIKSLEKIFSKRFFLCAYIICSLGGAVAMFFNIPLLGDLEYNNPIVTISAFSLFLMFAQLRIKNPIVVKFVTFFAPLAFGVFLIHANFIFERWYQQFQFCKWLEGNSYIYVIGVPVFVIFIFVLCSLMEYLRVKLFKLINEKELTVKFCNRLDLLSSTLINKAIVE